MKFVNDICDVILKICCERILIYFNQICSFYHMLVVTLIGTHMADMRDMLKTVCEGLGDKGDNLKTV